MNKGMTVLILVVLLGAMGLVLYTHTQQAERVAQTVVPPAAGSAPQPVRDSASLPVVITPSPTGAPAPSRNGGLAQFEPPLSSVAAAPTEGSHAPVVVVAGNNGEPARVISPPATSGGKPEASLPNNRQGPQLKPEGPGASPVPPTPSKPKPEAKPVQPSATAPAAKTEKTPPLSEKGAHTLKKIGLHFAGQRMQLRIEAESAFPCKAFLLTGPDRLVVDLPGSWKGMETPKVPENRLIKGVRTGKQGSGARIVLDLEQPLKNHEIVRQNNVVEIYLQ